MERYYQKEIECASREQIRAWQDERLVQQVKHVWENVPYYRAKMEEKELRISYREVELKQTYRADYVCYGKIIVELKAVHEIDDVHRAQVINYLHITQCKLGILLNFGHPDELQFERLVL